MKASVVASRVQNPSPETPLAAQEIQYQAIWAIVTTLANPSALFMDLISFGRDVGEF
jgi:hypothetical protein